MHFEFEVARIHAPDAKKYHRKWAYRCACGHCSANWQGPFKTLREAKEAMNRWSDEIVASAASPHH